MQALLTMVAGVLLTFVVAVLIWLWAWAVVELLGPLLFKDRR